VLTKINSDIECALVGFLKSRVKMHGDDKIKSRHFVYEGTRGILVHMGLAGWALLAIWQTCLLNAVKFA
jgi:hypothetical protein